MTNTQAATLMIQGTISDAGKSLLVAGFCRCLKRLGYLPINTTLQVKKQLTHSQGKLLLQADGHNSDTQGTVTGYQIHVGHTEREAGFNAFALLDKGQLDKVQLEKVQLEKRQLEGCVSADNHVAGSYLHGMFDSPQALQQIIAWAGTNTDEADSYVSQQEHELDRLADACIAHLDWQKIHTFITDQTNQPTNKEQTP